MKAVFFIATDYITNRRVFWWDRVNYLIKSSVLREIGCTLAGSLPPDAMIARISGDEYVIALPGASAESALIQLEEVRSHYASHGVEGAPDREQ